MSHVHRLYRLQQIDSEIVQKKERLREVLQAQKMNQTILAAQQKADGEAQVLQEWRSRQRALELELAGVSEKASRSDKRLYSGNVKNPKELADLEHELEALGRRRDAIEDEILEAMVMVEDAESSFEGADNVRRQAEDSWATRLKSLQTEQTEMATRINELLALRKEQVARIPPDLLAVYTATGKNSGGIAVSAFEGSRCQVCGVTVSTTKEKAVDEGQLVYCGSCGRILSLP